MKGIDRSSIERALAEVKDPELHRPLTELNMIKSIEITGNDVRVAVALTTQGCPLKETIVNSVRERLQRVPGVGEVRVELTEMSAGERQHLFGVQLAVPLLEEGSPTRIIAVASGKGGVGKSTVTVNLAAALQKKGFDVGILDCDIYGFSVPRMVGVANKKPTVIDGKIIPLPAYGMKIMSMGNMVADDQPVVWRGPMLGKILRQFLGEVVWGPLDFLLLDLPPGTGDMALDVAVLIPKAALLIVTTPQIVASGVATRAAHMAKKTNQRIIGVVENMSHFACPHCGEETTLFGEGGGKRVAQMLEVPLLGQIPLTLEARTLGDQGIPVALSNDSPAAKSFTALADSVVDQLAGLHAH